MENSQEINIITVYLQLYLSQYIVNGKYDKTPTITSLLHDQRIVGQLVIIKSIQFNELKMCGKIYFELFC